MPSKSLTVTVDFLHISITATHQAREGPCICCGDDTDGSREIQRNPEKSHSVVQTRMYKQSKND